MAEFIITYRGGSQPATPEEGAAHMQRWKEWLGDLGDAVVNPGTPLGKSKLVTSDAVVDDFPDALTGFSVVEAADMDAALVIAKACPFLEMDNSSVEVAQVMSMNG